MLSPLTLERFRICEFYAELLHCSNMSLLNRTDRTAALYDESGHLARGFEAADELAAALAAPGQTSAEDDLDLPRELQSPEIPVPSDFSTSPNDHSFGPYSGMSTPSGRESLDEESGGVLTKAEAKELKAIIAAAGKIDEEEGDDERGRAAAAAADEAHEVDESATPRAAASDGAKRDSRTSNGSSLREEHDLPPTPSVYSVASRQLPAVPLPPGPLLKSKFLEHGVVPTMLVRPPSLLCLVLSTSCRADVDLPSPQRLFFEFPWHNFLHNVVFDLIQQIFHGRLDRTLDRQLAESVFTDGKLCERILDGQKANDVAACVPFPSLFLSCMSSCSCSMTSLQSGAHQHAPRLHEPPRPDRRGDRQAVRALPRAAPGRRVVDSAARLERVRVDNAARGARARLGPSRRRAHGPQPLGRQGAVGELAQRRGRRVPDEQCEGDARDGRRGRAGRRRRGGRRARQDCCGD